MINDIQLNEFVIKHMQFNQFETIESTSQIDLHKDNSPQMMID